MSRRFAIAVDDTRFSPEALAELGLIEAFRGRFAAAPGISHDRIEMLAARVRIQSISAGLQINGIRIDDAAVDSVLVMGRAAGIDSETQAAISDYAWTYDRIVADHDRMAMDERQLKDLHRGIFRSSKIHERQAGLFRTTPLLFPPPTRRPGSIIGAVPPRQIPAAVQHLASWLEEARGEQRLDPLYQAAVFVGRFLEIAPFARGNGRVALLLAGLLLRQTGHSYLKCLSLERAILRHQWWIVNALEPGPNEAPLTDVNWEAVYSGLVGPLRDGIHQLEKLVSKDASIPLDLPPLSVRVLSCFEGAGALSNRDLVLQMGLNRNTLKLHLKTLVSRGLLKLEGSGRSARYALAKRT